MVANYLPNSQKLIVKQMSNIKLIDELREQYRKELTAIVQNKNTNQKRDAQGVIHLAELLEEIYIKSNQKSEINTICTEICRDFKASGDPHWYYVYDYLDPYPKYKSQSHADRRRKHVEEMENDISPVPSSS